MSLLRLETEVYDRILLVRLIGELDHHSANMLRERMDQAILEGNIDHILLNLKQLSFMDSSGLGVILGRYKLIANRQGRMVVCSMNPMIYRLFELSGMFKILSVKESEEEALLALGVA